MNERIWLVRTFDKKILGPISREKLVGLLRDNKLSESDEICPGNHHWVYVKEKETLSKILQAPEIMEMHNDLGNEVVAEKSVDVEGLNFDDSVNQEKKKD